VVILTPLKSFFYYGVDTDYYPSRCKDIKGLWLLKDFYDVCGWGQWSLNTILF
jgi:hypothetical protein